MNVVWFLIPVSILLGILFLVAFIWSVKKGQLDDMETPAYRMLLDDEESKNNINNYNSKKGKEA